MMREEEGILISVKNKERRNMNIDELLLELSHHIDMQNYIEITMNTFGSEKSQCIPISLSDRFLLVAQYIDFRPDGYVIIRLEDIQSIRFDEVLAYFREIVKKEGSGQIISEAPKLDLNSFETIFKMFKESKQIIMIEIGEDEAINIGIVTDLSDDAVSMLCFDAMGVWNDEEWIEPYQNITGISFSTHYIETFTKYINDVREKG